MLKSISNNRFGESIGDLDLRTAIGNLKSFGNDSVSDKMKIYIHVFGLDMINRIYREISGTNVVTPHMRSMRKRNTKITK